MNLAKKLSVMLTILIWSNCISIHAQTFGKLTIYFENIEVAKGQVQVALYRAADDFMDTEKAILFSYPVNSKGTLKAQIENLELGPYAFASFHDEDDNEKLNTNFFGIPKEPYCFSKQPPSKWRPPTFEEAQFEIKAGENELTVFMQRWQF